MENSKLNIKEAINFLRYFSADSRLNVWQAALLSAILILGVQQGRKQGIRVSRSKLMAIAHIHTLPTYHKYFKSLQEMGLIVYKPSYHPGFRSRVDLVIVTQE